MIVTAFRPEHLKALQLQPSQAAFSLEIVKPGYAEMLQEGGPAFTAKDGDNVIACAGVAEVWTGRAMAWALISEQAGRHFLGIHRAVDGFLKQAQYRRIEATVDDGFDQAHRWMRMLGFQCETPDGMPGFLPDGGRSFLYAKVK